MLNQVKQIYLNNKTIVENFSYLTILQVVSMLIPLITYPYLIRVLGKDTYGLVIFVQAVIGYLVILINFGFNISATKEISINKDNKKKINEIVSSVFILKGGLFVISSLLILIIINTLPQAKEFKILFLLTMHFCLSEWLFPIWYFQGIEKMKYITILNIINRTIFTVLIFFLIMVFIRFPFNILIVSKLYELKILNLSFKTHIFVEVLPMSPIKNFIFF